MTLKRFFAVLTGFLALSAVPAAYGDDGDNAFYVNQKKFVVNSIGGVCGNCAGKIVEVTQACCDMPAIGQIPCIGPMFKIGAGVANVAEGCKCCKSCAEGKNGECTCAKKPKTAAVGMGIGCCVGINAGTPKVFTPAVRRGEVTVVPTTSCVPPICPALPMAAAPMMCPHPVQMAVTQCVPQFVTEKVMIVTQAPMSICVAKQEPDSEVRKVEWRMESDFLGTAGHLEIHNGNTTVCCEKMMLKTAGCGAIKVCCEGGRVSIEGDCVKGKADHVTTDHQGSLVLKGNIHVAYEKDGQSVKVQGSQCTVHVMHGKVEVMMK